MAVTVELGDGHLQVALTGWDRVLALKSSLSVPVASITSVEAKGRNEIERLPGRWLRLPGTYVPSMVHHGSYGRKPHRDFWALFRQERVLVVHMAGWEYERLILAVADPDAVAAELSRALPRA